MCMSQDTQGNPGLKHAAEGRLAAMCTLTGMEAAKVGIDIAQAGDRLVTKA